MNAGFSDTSLAQTEIDEPELLECLRKIGKGLMGSIALGVQLRTLLVSPHKLAPATVHARQLVEKAG